jgi:hypothetical protein
VSGAPVTLPPPLDRLDAAPVFITGCARSGTTWVLDIYGAHPDVAVVSESWLFSPAAGVLPLLSDAHWSTDKRGLPQGLGRVLSKEDFLAELRAFLAQLLGRSLVDGQRFLVEKSPNHVWNMDKIAEVFPEARFVHVLRDGRDVAVSLLAAGASWAPHWTQSAAGSIQQAASTWRLAVEQAVAAKPLLGDKLLEVRYEDLHRDPASTCRRLFEFAEIPYDDDLVEGVMRATDFQTNFVPNEAGFRRGGRIGDWKTSFDAADCLAFQLEAGALLIALGYEADDRWVERLASSPVPERPTGGGA